MMKHPYEPEKVRLMLQAGVDAVRVKFAHLEPARVLEIIRDVQRIIRESGTPTKLFVDLPEEKVRVGWAAGASRSVVAGQHYRLVAAERTDASDVIPVSVSALAGLFAVGDHVWVGDGELSFTVVGQRAPEEFDIEFSTDGAVIHRTGLFSERLITNLHHRDVAIAALPDLAPMQPDMLGCSFMQSAEDLHAIRAAVATADPTWQPLLAAKIESNAGVEAAASIAPASDLFVVARGDLGLAVGTERLPAIQKELCRIGKAAHRPVAVATHIGNSLLTADELSAADRQDLTQIVADGADWIWISRGTAYHPRPDIFVQKIKAFISTLK